MRTKDNKVERSRAYTGEVNPLKGEAAGGMESPLHGLTRRTFLTALAALAPASTLASEEQKVLEYMRPPGAVPEKDFLARCNRCQRCVQVCETRIVFPASFKYGLRVANTPVIAFDRSFCNSCLKCGPACPTGALHPVTMESLDIGLAVIVEPNCVAWDWVGCTACVDKCPLHAIYLDEYKRPWVLPERCNGCGICQYECPSTSLRVSIKGKGVVVKPRPLDAPPREVLPPGEIPPPYVPSAGGAQ